MDVFSILKLLGGIALFLYGMYILSSHLEKMSGGRAERTLRRVTSSPIKSLLLGVGITAIIQSSSAVTVMLVGLVNSGIMELGQAVGVVLGSNIGTTATAWILSLAGIESSNTFVKLLKPENFSAVFAVIGVILVMFSKKPRRQDIGGVCVGFAVLMFGMATMSDSVAGLRNNEGFTQFLTMFNNPFLGVLVGAVFTGIIQSSSASVGLLQAFSINVGISYGVAIPIIMGQNIGTCVTALLASIGTSKNARRVAIVHIYFNVIGTVVFFALIYGSHLLINYKFLDNLVGPAGIAVFHTIFNVATTILLLPFRKGLEKMAISTVKNRPGEDGGLPLLEDLLLASPAFAVANCRELSVRMLEMARENVTAAMDGVASYSPKSADKFDAKEKELDLYEDKLSTYLMRLAQRELTTADSSEIARMLRAVGDIERMGDHAQNVMDAARSLYDRDISFSDAACEDFKVLQAAINDVVAMTLEAIRAEDLGIAKQVEPLEEVIDHLTIEARSRHISRVQSSECGVEQGFLWSAILMDLERVSDHCSNMAVGMIQATGGSMERHNYLLKTRTADNEEFVAAVNRLRERYILQARGKV